VAKVLKAAVVLIAVIALIGVTQGLALSFIGKAFVVAGFAIVADAFKPKEPEIRQGGLKSELRSSIAPRQLLYGNVRLAGTMVAAFSTGTDNKFVHFIFVIAAHEINDYVKFFVNEDEVTLDGSDLVAAGKYAGKIRILTEVGTQSQAANATLVSDISQWTTAHRLRGLAYYSVRFEFDREVFTQGRPVITVLVEGAKVLDTRDSVTKFTNNWALVNHDYLTIGGGSAWDIGCRFPTSDFTVANIDAEANISDEAVNLKAGGTQPRYTADGRLFSTSIREVNLHALLSAGAGQLIYQGIGFKLYAGAAPTVSVQLDDDDLRGPVTVATRRPIQERVNRVIGVFLDATDDLYEENNYPPATNATFVTEDEEVVYEKRLDLPFTQHPARAQRIAKIELERRRRQMNITYPCKISGLQIQAWSTLGLTNTKYSFVAKEFQVLRWSFTATGVDLELQEHDSAIYSWVAATDEVSSTSPALPIIDDGSTTAAVTTLAVAAVNIVKDSTKVPVLVATWDAPGVMVAQTEVQFKRNVDSLWEPGPAIPDVSNPRATLQGFLPTESIDIRVRHINNFGVLGAFNTKTANIVGPDWILDGGVADSIPFDDVTGASKPDDNANVNDADLAALDPTQNTKLNGIDTGATVGADAGAGGNLTVVYNVGESIAIPLLASRGTVFDHSVFQKVKDWTLLGTAASQFRIEFDAKSSGSVGVDFGFMELRQGSNVLNKISGTSSVTTGNVFVNDFTADYDFFEANTQIDCYLKGSGSTISMVIRNLEVKIGGINGETGTD